MIEAVFNKIYNLKIFTTGIEAKIKNIEATEEAKMKMRDDSKNRKKESSDFVPTNMASNFMHHNRFYNEKAIFDKEQRKEQVKK